ncbi:MAG: AAA family ATPase [Deltaproteobacteria bacterium]|nr:AAA family ATPase [Deltaproteobacteria bacterium]
MSSETLSEGQCPACGCGNAPAARFCNQCGAALKGGAASPPAAEAERKQVTVLFSDLTGYTALSEKLDPEETREIMGRIFGRAAEIVGRYGGHIEKFIGDAIMAIFGVPAAHEDDPERAVRAALELHEAVEALSPEVEKRTGGPIALHTGVNTGLVVTGELKFDHGTAGPLGDTINLAARLMSLAGEGEIWIGPETRKLVASAFELQDLGQREVKGKAEPVAVARVVGASSRAAASARFRGAFVGRQEEIGVLLGAAEQMRDGRPAVIAICGEAGTGKTRLVEEFRARVGNDIQWIEGRAYPYAENIPYFPVIDLLNRSWGIDENDKPAAVRLKVEAGVSALVESSREVLPVIARLYNIELADGPVIDREAFQRLLFDAVRRLLAALACRGPTVICLQDLHWADTSTVTLVRGLTTDFKVPAVLICNYRPGYAPGPGTRVLELRELSSRQTRELLQSLLGSEPPDALTRFIEERSDGNPFYVEEVVNSLVETHVLTRNGTWKIAGALSEAVVPTTIRGVIAARIDRLDEPRRRVLRNAAVIGREFLYSVVAQVTGEADDEADGLQPSLAQLEAADLIRARSGAADVEYIFKHALTQEVAYDGLLKSERQALHQRAAFAMERIFADRMPEFVETLAYHFLHAGVVDKAVHYLRESGKKCVARYAIEDAATHYRNAYALLSERERTPAEDRALVELLNDWSLVHYYQGDCRAWRLLLEANLKVAEGVGDPELLGLYLGWTGHMLYWHEEYPASIEHLDRAAQLGEKAGSAHVLAYAETWRAWTLALLARPSEAIAAGERAMILGQQFPDEPYVVFKPLGAIVMAAAMTGDLKRARLAAEDLLAIAARTGNSRAAVLGHASLAICHSAAFEHERAIESGKAALEASLDPAYRHLSAVYLASALGTAQCSEELVRLAQEVLPAADQLSQNIISTIIRLATGPAVMSLGEPSRGISIIEAARRQPSCPWVEVVATNILGIVYARIARREGRADLSVLLRNPGFIIRHVLPARRKARALLERTADHPLHRLAGYSGSAMFELALLHAHRGEREAARARATQALEVFERQGALEALRQARALADSLAPK